MVPISHLRCTKVCNVGPEFLAIFLREVLDLSWLAIDLGVQLGDFLACRPQCNEAMLRIFDGLRV